MSRIRKDRKERRLSTGKDPSTRVGACPGSPNVQPAARGAASRARNSQPRAAAAPRLPTPQLRAGLRGLDRNPRGFRSHRSALLHIIERLLAGACTTVAVERTGRRLADGEALAAGRAAVPIIAVLNLLRLVREAACRAAPLVRVRHEALAVVGPGVRLRRSSNAGFARLFLARRNTLHNHCARLSQASLVLRGHLAEERGGHDEKCTQDATHHRYRSSFCRTPDLL